MANKRVTSKENPLVQVLFRIPKSQKDFLDNLDIPASDFIRKLISAQMEGYDVELSKLNEEERELEVKLNVVKAQKKEILEAISKKQLVSQGREELIKKQAEGLIPALRSYHGELSKLDRAIKVRTEGINQKLNGTGAEPVKPEEIKQALITYAQAQGVEYYDE